MFAVALAGAVLVRWTAVRGYPGVLWFTGDSYFYLGRALRPSPSPSKSIGYSLLLRVMEPLHDLTAVAVAQHLMGLAVAVLGYALLRRCGLGQLPATVVVLPVLFDARQVQLEHLLMSEALFTFLIAAALALLLWRVREPSAAPGRAAASAAGLLLGFAVLVRSAGAPLVPLVLAGLLLWRGGWRAAAAFGLAAALPLASYGLWFRSVHGTFGLTSSDGLYLWGRTAVFADCAKIRPPSHQEPLCLRPELRAAGHHPGHLIWRSEAPPRVLYENVTSPFANATMRDFAIRAILAQPGDYLGVVADGVGKAFSPHRFPVPTAATESLYHFPERPQIFPGGRSWGADPGRPSTALTDAVRYGRTWRPSRVVEPYAGRTRAYERAVTLPGPVLGAVFAAGGLGVALGRRRRAVLLVWGTAVTLLVFPIASADFDYRYVVPATPFACLALGLALTPRTDRDSGRAGRWTRPGGLSRWWGSPGSPRRGSGRASAP
ncbi:phospholipid carrier-dependent glycosyltransferase [Actinomadura kijaniata]|uniref:phospholipid carrier-dependent glycosyltransferase n=1 Tax=Actinomadura kijaniata TaxID=46161 RepID=UPI003F1C0D2B